MTTVDDPRVWSGLQGLYQSLSRDLDAQLTRRCDLPLSWFEVLRVVAARSEPPLRVSDIGDQVTLSPSRVCRVLHALEQRGVVERLTSPADGRATEVVATDAGLALCATAQEVQREVLAGGPLAKLTQAQRRSLATVLDRLADVPGA
jgi:DNA-binding MarR family transcriptional regulator